MKLISFKDSSSQRVYNNYIERCKKVVKILSEQDREECLLEINSHIYEYVWANETGNEMQRLLDVLDRLGNPEETLKEVVAAKKIRQARKTFNPKHLFQALLLNVGNGLIYTVLFVLFLVLACFPVLMVLKVIYPDNVGLFISTNGFNGFGYLSNVNNANELLGNWFILVTAIIMAGLYFVVVFLLNGLKRLKIDK